MSIAGRQLVRALQRIVNLDVFAILSNEVVLNSPKHVLKSSLPRKLTNDESNRANFYPLVWRWHFFAGLFTAPFISVLAATGLIYLYSAEIETTLRQDQVIVEPTGPTLPLSTIIESAKGEYPDRQVSNVMVPHQKNFATFVTMTDDLAEHEQVVFVDPYSAKVTAGFDHKNDSLHDFFHIVLDIHRSLFIGITGRIITETVTSWSVILLVTGAFLWWPRKKDRLNGVLVPRLNQVPRKRLRDLHALAGFYHLPVLLVIVTTGLFYSHGLGSAIYTANATAFADPTSADLNTEETVESEVREATLKAY